MPDPLALQLARLRESYSLMLFWIVASPMDDWLKQERLKDMMKGIAELDQQIANEERLHCDIEASKRYADCHEQ